MCIITIDIIAILVDTIRLISLPIPYNSLDIVIIVDIAPITSGMPFTILKTTAIIYTIASVCSIDYII